MVFQRGLEESLSQQKKCYLEWLHEMCKQKGLTLEGMHYLISFQNSSFISHGQDESFL